VIPVDVVGLRLDAANQPILVLQEAQGSRLLPIWIGSAEATAIDLVRRGIQPARPLTHDLLRDLLAALGRSLDSVHVTSLDEGVFYAELHLDDGLTLSCRPSDAIALALRTASPILVAEAVLDTAGIAVEGNDEESEEQVVEQFREFLDDITPEDFADPSPEN